VFGHFVNTVVIRTRISPGMTCTQLLKEVRATMIEAYTHQELPFEKLAEVLERERNIDRASLFQVLCNYQKVQLEPPHRTGITIAPFKVARVIGVPEVSRTPIEMIFDARELPTMLTLSVNYRSGILNKSQRSRMKEQLTNILQGLVLQTRTVESVGVDVFNFR
jgi:non-ribosomal peptide synthetase component F